MEHVTGFLERHFEYFSLYRIWLWTGEVNNVELIDHGQINVTAL
jgi:hypothetical protein